MIDRDVVEMVKSITGNHEIVINELMVVDD
jgi:hypothetical protein